MFKRQKMIPLTQEQVDRIIQQQRVEKAIKENKEEKISENSNSRKSRLSPLLEEKTVNTQKSKIKKTSRISKGKRVPNWKLRAMKYEKKMEKTETNKKQEKKKKKPNWKIRAMNYVERRKELELHYS